MIGDGTIATADQVLDALGDRTRRMLVSLVAQSPMSVSDLARALDITKTAVGQHVAILVACGLLQSHKQGRVRMCWLDRRGLTLLEGWIAAHRGHWQAGLARLGDALGPGRADPD